MIKTEWKEQSLKVFLLMFKGVQKIDLPCMNF